MDRMGELLCDRGCRGGRPASSRVTLLNAILAAWLVVCSFNSQAQDAAAAAAASQPASAAYRAGPGQPPVVVAATSDKVTVSVVIRGFEAEPVLADFSSGLVTNDEQPNLVSRPSIDFAAKPSKTEDRAYVVDLLVGGLFAFGQSSVPLLHKGTLVETLRVSRPGLVVKPGGEDGFVAREGDADSRLLLVLDNPAGFEYGTVRARLRFADTAICAFGTERFPGAPKASAQTCDTPTDWSAFNVPRFARVTLLAGLSGDWFRDPETGRARIGKKKGVLTLRFEDKPGGPVYEQNLPLEVEFVPDKWSQFKSLASVGGLLLVGAIFSLFLRVSVPNMKRKRQLKDQLGEAAKLISTISTEVDSNLRVLLRVERLALDEIRQDGLQIGPGYADYALRVEQGLPALKRRIDAVRRLDAALIRRRLMMEQGPAPTRLEQVEERLAIVSEVLKQDSLSDEDWVLVSQRLETAQKIMREPTQTEKEAFEAMLVGRWKSIRKHFGGTGVLKVPKVLEEDMAACFPGLALLPKSSTDAEVNDPDGSKWIQEIGPARADLQLSALALVWEFEFLVPPDLDKANELHARWFKAMEALNRLLATPAVSNLREAKSLLRQLAEGVDEERIQAALTSGNACIVMDPAVPRPNQKIRFAVRLSPEHLGSSAARDLVTCRWTFSDRHVSSDTNWVSHHWSIPESTLAATQVQELFESGWSVHHYFEKGIDHSKVSVAFYGSKGVPIKLDGAPLMPDGTRWYEMDEAVTASRRPKEKWARFWLETVQVGATLLVPLATLASTTLNGGGGANWWELIAIGFASDTIKNVLVGTSSNASNPVRP